MKRSLVLWLILSFAFAIGLRAAEIDESLQMMFRELPDGEAAQALVYLTEQADLPGLDRQLKAGPATLAERNHRVILALQEVASRTQPDVAAFLDDLKVQGLVKNYTMYWIANLFRVEANRAGIEAIAARPDINKIYLDYEIEGIKPAAQHGDGGLLTGHEIGLTRIHAPEAWAQGWTGAGRVVMNIDTGVDGGHPALSARFRGDVDGDGDVDESWFDPYTTHYPNPRDDGSHGTHTMGTMCGRTTSGDTIGVAIEAQWIAAAAIDRGGGIPRTVADAIASFEWAVDPDGDPNTQDNPDAIGNSWGLMTSHGYPPCDETFWLVIDNCEIAGSAVIFSAGNEGPSPNSLRRPADRGTTPFNCFAVGAVDGRNANLPIADFSSRGPSDCGPDGEQVIKPEVVAPGVQVRSSVPGGGYQSWDGTSMASPHITGSVAVLRQVNPNLDVDTIKRILLDTAHDLPFNNPDGEDNTYGMGVIDLYQACLAAQTGFGSVEGYVTASGGGPIEGALVRVVGGFPHDNTDANGYYFMSMQAETTYTIEASFFGYIPVDTEVAITANDTARADFTLQLAPSGSLHGTVVDMADSMPIVGANVEIVGAPIDPVPTNDSGYYEFLAIPGGSTYTIRVRASGYGIGQDTVFIPIGQSRELNFALQAFESFENDDGGWSGTGVWEWGQPTSGPDSAYDGTNVWATVLGGDYPDNADDPLFTGYYTVESQFATFSFYQWYEFENSYDGGNVGVSTDGGLNWTIIDPQSGYPDDNITGLDGERGFTGITGGWQEAVFDVGAYQGMAVKFKFRFGSDVSIQRAGWYIDAVVLSGGTAWNQGTPDISVSPLSFNVGLQMGDTTFRQITISNSGDGLLAFGIDVLTFGGLLGAPAPVPIPMERPAEFNMDRSKDIVYEVVGDKLNVSYRGPKIESNDDTYPPMLLDSGGPDEFGYFWIDSNEPGGPTFEWVDISAIGQQVVMGDDENQGPFDLGFEYPFYDSIYSSIRICSNGWISPTSTSTSLSNTFVPNTTTPNDIMPAFWDDLDPRNAGAIYFYTNNVDSAIVAWVDIPHYGNTGTYTFEIILTADGDIFYQYNSLSGLLNSHTIGIENSTGTIGLQVAYNQAYAVDGLAVRFVVPIFWMYASPTGGFALPSDAFHGNIVFDARGLDIGQYTGQLNISSNDPDEPTVVVPCTLNVGPVGVEESSDNLPTSFSLMQNYPNPFNPSTQISFALPRQSEVNLAVYDLLGRQVKILASGRMNAGVHTVVWDGTDQTGKTVTSGVYFYSIKAGDNTEIRRMVLMK